MVGKYMLGPMLACLVTKQAILMALIYGTVVKQSSDLRLLRMFYV